jgi:hypothetical protein
MRGIKVVELLLGIIAILLLAIFALIWHGLNAMGSNQGAIHGELVKLQKNPDPDAHAYTTDDVYRILLEINARMRDNRFYTHKESKEIDDQNQYG